MKGILTILSALILFSSCSDEEGYYSYLFEPNAKAETVRMKFSGSSGHPVFGYTIQAQEMVIDWGDGSPFSEYLHLDRNNETDSITAISRLYSKQGTYDVLVKAIQLRGLILSRSGDNTLTELSLTDCRRLRKLYCENQPISQLDISSCPELRVLACGYPQGELSLTGVQVPKKLGELYINGSLSSANIELAGSDSLRVLQLKNTNLQDIQLSDLEKLTVIKIDSCDDLKNIYIGANPLLSDIVLTNNINLNASALNYLFQNLPSSDNKNRHITLSGNEGDAICNRNIAISKGWVFR